MREDYIPIVNFGQEENNGIGHVPVENVHLGLQKAGNPHRNWDEPERHRDLLGRTYEEITEADDLSRNVTDYVNPNVFPIPNTFIGQKKNKIIRREDGSKLYMNNGHGIVLIYEGPIDLTEIMRNYVLKDIEVNSINILKTMESILRIGEQRGYTKKEHF